MLQIEEREGSLYMCEECKYIEMSIFKLINLVINLQCDNEVIVTH